MKRSAVWLSLFSAGMLCAAEGIFQHSLTGGKYPWTHEKFQNSPETFRFAILPDRAGSERRGVFPKAFEKLEMMRPEFVICVGDLIQGMTNKKTDEAELRRQWKELRGFTEKLSCPFFYLVGNHDIGRSRPGFPKANERTTAVWKENLGPNTYYSFVYKNVLFLCLNNMEGRDSRPKPCGITGEQLAWAKKELVAHPDVHWTIVFIHAPGGWKSMPFEQLEKVLVKRNYTVFSGDWHRYIRFQRHGRNYYVLATAGGVSKMRGILYGEFDHITWVTMTEKGPVVANILLDGILPDDVVTMENYAGDDKRDLNLPDPAKKVKEK